MALENMDAGLIFNVVKYRLRYEHDSVLFADFFESFQDLMNRVRK